ncbi:MAG: hypothetical protein WBP45_13590 [Daejeonella sp.]
MIEFLKESTFAVNDVINKSWKILYKNYRNIAGLCLSMFLVIWMSAFLSSFSNKKFSILNFIMLLLFVVIYFGLQLTLFKYILHIISEIDKDEENFKEKFKGFLKHNILKMLINLIVPFAFIFIMSVLTSYFELNALWPQIITVLIGLAFVVIRLWNQIKPFILNISRFWPTKRHFANFLIASLYAALVSLITFIVITIIFFPLVFLGIRPDQLVNISIPVGVILTAIVIIRISFFPFFILDLDLTPFKSIKFSLAVTKGNFTRLLFLFGIIIIVQFIGGYYQNKEYYFLTLSISVVYSFLLIPLASVSTAVAYRQMINEYHGDANPEIMQYII